MDTGKNANETPTYRCQCCGKEHPITAAMIQAAVSGLLCFTADDIEEEAASALLRAALEAR